MMIDIGDVVGVLVNGNSGVINCFGVGVVSVGSSYCCSDILVDVVVLLEDVDVSSFVISQVLMEGVVGYWQIDVNQGEQVFGYIWLVDGVSLLFGVLVVFGKIGRIVGMVGDGGLVYLIGFSGEDCWILNVFWDGWVQCRFILLEMVIFSWGLLLLFCR